LASFVQVSTSLPIGLFARPPAVDAHVFLGVFCYTQMIHSTFRAELQLLVPQCIDVLFHARFSLMEAQAVIHEEFPILAVFPVLILLALLDLLLFQRQLVLQANLHVLRIAYIYSDNFLADHLLVLSVTLVLLFDVPQIPKKSAVQEQVQKVYSVHVLPGSIAAHQ
jgi:hypothetical protein